jgi:arabinogalactan endo-1,4-beta-galactosidase
MRAAVAFFLLGACWPAIGPAHGDVPFAKVADVGWLSEMEANGTPFYNAQGQPEDCLQILKDYGINSIRLRVWVNPEKGWCGKDDVLKMAKRAAAMGFRIMIDFHYSDWWADPQKQPKPAAWQNDDSTQLQKDVYDHTYDVLKGLQDEGVTPKWVQVGNEITNGMLWPDGKTSNRAELVQLLNSGYAAVKAVDPNMQVIIHLNNGAGNGMFRNWFDAALKDGLKFDVIGMSLYPERNNWQQESDKCIANLKDMSARYHKDVMVCEIGFYDTEPQISKDFLVKMIKGCEEVPGGKGLGVFYWEPEGYTQHYNRNAWQADGKPGAAMDAFLTQ